MPARLGPFLGFCLVLAILCGCAVERAVPELITLTEVAPHRVGAGDVLEVRGVGLPVGDVGKARVVFKGDLHRPAERPLVGHTIEVENARLERDRVSFEISDELLDRFTGHGDEALHTTFRGTVEVWLPGASSGLPVHGSIRGTTVLEIEPRAPRRTVLEARLQSAKEAHTFLGLELGSGEGEGVTVRSVRAGSPAEKAGLHVNDTIVSFNGVSALDPSDVAPSGRESAVAVSVLRGEERQDLSIDVTGYRGDASREIVGAGAVIGTLFLVLLLFASRLGSALTWIVHRLERAGGSPQAKHGRLAGLLRRATRAPDPGPGSTTFTAALPILAFAGATATFAILPWFELRGRSEVDVTLLYLVSLTSFATMGLVTGGWTEVGPGIIGRLRALGTVVVCELPAACALGAVVLRTGSVRASDIAAAQVGSQGNTIETGGFPWYWNAVKSPLVFLLFACFFLTLLVDGSSPQRSLQSADAQAPATGMSLRRGAFLFAEWANVLVMCAIGTLAFLGGWYVPGFGVHEHAQSDWLVALGVGWFLLKCWLLAGLVLALRAALPRLSPIALMKAGYRAMLPLAVVALGLSAAVARYPLLPSVERATTFATLGVAIVVGLIVVTGARSRRSDARAPRRFARVNTML